ncbi:CdaR family protein [Bacillus sp. FJAT-47783]|uniref:CdaR family protein n=1 Tax=Bacillus sp. FJAT-47783 TaxID=2922712 RepID=UPI001FAD61FB|nr:CdaR family protein [Bacillus sp. FJAT-47783]
MDKFMNSKWFVRVISLFLAVMLYVSVNIESPSSTKHPNDSLFPTTTTTDSETLTEIPVSVYYDEEKYAVTGVPQTVTVTLEGPTGLLTTTKQVKDFEIYADLRELPVGTHRVQLKHKNVSDKLRITINPSVITVNIQPKVTEDFPVEVDFINKEKMKEGYTPEEAIVHPSTVKITGAKEDLNRIAFVKARVDLEGVDETIEKESIVTVYDQNGTVLPVEVEPNVVTVTVPVKSPSKLIPINVKKKGTLPEGLSIENISVDPNEVTVYGEKSILEKLEFLDGVEVDLSKIQEDTTLEVELPKPEGVTKIVPERVNISIELNKEEELSFEGLPIKTVGLNDSENLTFLDPENAQLDILLKGAENVLKNIKKSDIELYINVADIGEGQHNLDVQVNGPQNITWTLSKNQIKVQISSSEVVEEETEKDEEQTSLS